jgi:cytochrome P450
VNAPFTPPYPPRGAGPVPVWMGFVGERARTAVYGWSERAFTLPYMRRKVFGIDVHIPLDPDIVQRVLLDNAANYVKPTLIRSILGPVIGEGLLTSDGQLWRDQRRIVAANFAPAAVDEAIPAFARAAHATMGEWRSGPVDMASQSTRTTMRIIADTLFGGDPRLTAEEPMRHIAAALEGVSEARLQAILGLPRIPLSRKGRAGRRGQMYLRKTLAEVVADRQARGGGGDFLGKLIAALRERFAPDRAMALAVDNAATFYLAGHETTANALSWTLFLLSEQSALQDSLAAEARAAIAVGEDDPDLPERLPRLRLALEEALRLYPPAPRMDRQAVAADRLGEEEVKPGDIVSIWPWLLHRHKALWDDPDRFDPERFAEGGRARHRFQYLPFGGGPRVCVGARFATAEALTILAHWLSAWRFAPVPGREVRVHGLVTLRPAGGLPLVLSPREA